MVIRKKRVKKLKFQKEYFEQVKDNIPSQPNIKK